MDRGNVRRVRSGRVARRGTGPRAGAPPGRGSDVAEIKRRYRELALKHHPDKCDLPDAAERFAEINEAYRVLSDDALRCDYDNQTFPYG